MHIQINVIIVNFLIAIGHKWPRHTSACKLHIGSISIKWCKIIKSRVNSGDGEQLRFFLLLLQAQLPHFTRSNDSKRAKDEFRIVFTRPLPLRRQSRTLDVWSSRLFFFALFFLYRQTPFWREENCFRFKHILWLFVDVHLLLLACNRPIFFEV